MSGRMRLTVFFVDELFELLNVVETLTRSLSECGRAVRHIPTLRYSARDGIFIVQDTERGKLTGEDDRLIWC